jgi:formiminoglutamase
MSGRSSSAAKWCTRLEAARPVRAAHRHPDDPRLGEVVEFWQGDLERISAGRAVLVGFPQDEGVRRNQGRPGAAFAPDEIRRWLYRLTPHDGESGKSLTVQPPLDLGNLRIDGDLKSTQEGLGEVIAAILQREAFPLVLGGGHETAYGHYLGYVLAGKPVGIINIDAHLDVRPLIEGKGHSGSPFRQALEHWQHPLPGNHYVCLGAQPHNTSQAHLLYARDKSCRITWRNEVEHSLDRILYSEIGDLAAENCHVYVSIDADVVSAGEVPGVSAPNVYGISAGLLLMCMRRAASVSAVTSMDLVEINPLFDCDGQSARWAALLIWNALLGHAGRR